MKRIVKSFFALQLLLLIPFGSAFFSFAGETGVSGFFEYRALTAQTVEIVRYTGNEENIEIPETLGGKTVVSVGESAFFKSDCVSVSIPNSVTAIGKSAFERCELLNTVHFSKKLKKLEERAFFGCSHFSAISLPDTLEEIGALAFSKTEAAFVDCPPSLKKVGYNPFDDTPLSNNQNIAGIYWGTWLIGYEDFPHGTKGEEFSIRETTTGIADRVFSPDADGHHPYFLPEIIIPKRVKYIGEYAFAESLFSKITIPDSVVSIEKGAFKNCTALKSIYLSKNVRHIGAGAFENTAAVNAQTGEIKYVGNWIVQSENTKQTLKIEKTVVGIAEASFLGSPANLTVLKNVKYISPHAFGYYKAGESYRKISSFKLKCEKNSAAQKFAQGNALSFETICLHERVSGWKIDKKATASFAGSKHKECLDCKKVLKTKKIPIKKCAAPVLQKAKNTKNGVRVTWKKTAGAKKYIVFRKISGGSWKRLGTTQKCCLIDKSAKHGVRYTYTVRAKNSAGVSKCRQKGVSVTAK